MSVAPAGSLGVRVVELDDGAWEEFERRGPVDPYCGRAFQAAQARVLDQRPVLILAEAEGVEIGYVVLLTEGSNGRTFVRTPEYGGPVLRLDGTAETSPSAWLRQFRTRLDDLLPELAVASEVAGISPWLPYRDEVIEAWEAQAEKDLCVSALGEEADRWSRLGKGRRHDIRRAERAAQLEWKRFDEPSVSEFAEHYAASMEEKGAARWWRLDRAYFASLAEQPHLDIRIATARGSTGGAAALFLLSGGTAAYLYASRWGALPGGPSLVLWHAQEQLRAAAIGRLLLGGGLSSAPDDTLFQFKRSLSDGVVPHFVAARAFDRDAHDDAAAQGHTRPLPPWTIER